MHGPEPRGHWTASLTKGAFEHLSPGTRYVVSKAFRDFDGHLHPLGESWEFLGHNYLPHDDGLSLFVSRDGMSEWHIRLQWRAEQQGEIIDNLGDYVRAAL